MTPGLAVKGVCYLTLADAEASQCQNDYPQSGTDSAGAPYVLSCVGVVTGGLSLAKTDASGTTSYTIAPTYSDCNADAVQSMEITPDVAGQAFVWGFGLVVFCYCIGWGIGQVLSMVDSKAGG